MVRALDPASSVPVTSPGQRHFVMFLCETITVHLLPLLNSWATANGWASPTECWGVSYDGLASHRGGGGKGSDTPSCFMLHKHKVKHRIGLNKSLLLSISLPKEL